MINHQMMILFLEVCSLIRLAAFEKRCPPAPVSAYSNQDESGSAFGAQRPSQTARAAASRASIHGPHSLSHGSQRILRDHRLHHGFISTYLKGYATKKQSNRPILSRAQRLVQMGLSDES